MISAISNIIDSLLIYMISLFPTANPDVVNNISTNLSTFKGYLASASFIFPANWFLYFVGTILTIELSLFTYRTIKLVVGYISLGALRE